MKEKELNELQKVNWCGSILTTQNGSILNDRWHEDIIYDDPDNSIQVEKDEQIENDTLKIVGTEGDDTVEAEVDDIEPSDEIIPKLPPKSI